MTTMRNLKLVTHSVVTQLMTNIQKLTTEGFQEQLTFAYDGREGLAEFTRTENKVIVVFEVYGVKTGFHVPINNAKESTKEYVTKNYSDAAWVAQEYMRINKDQIKIHYGRIKDLLKYPVESEVA